MFANEVSQILFSVRNRIQYTPNNYLNGFSGVWTPTFASRAVILPRTIKILGGRCCFITTDFINSKKEILIVLNESNSFKKVSYYLQTGRSTFICPCFIEMGEMGKSSGFTLLILLGVGHSGFTQTATCVRR